MLAVQLRAEDHRWQRDQRQAAYQAMLLADRRVEEAVAAAVRHGGPLTADLIEALRLGAAASREAVLLIDVTGPASVMDAASSLMGTHSDLWTQQPQWPQGPGQWGEAIGRLHVAQVNFRRAARTALGYVEPEPPDSLPG
nr:hypothetical protein [Streptomyces chartreusis]